LVLEAADVGVLRGELHRALIAVEHAGNRVLGLLQGVLGRRAHLDRAGRRLAVVILAHREQALLHLGDGVGLEDVDRDAARLRVAQGLRLAPEVGAERHDGVGVGQLLGYRHPRPRLPYRLFQPLPRDPERVEAPKGLVAPRRPTSFRGTAPALPAASRARALAGGEGRGRGRLLDDAHLVVLAQLAHFGGHLVAAQERIDRLGDVAVDGDALPALDLDDDVEGRRRLALEDRLLRAAAARFLIAERDRLDAADEVGQRRVQHQVFQLGAVRGGDELHPALGDRARRGGLELRADLVDDDHLGHVVLDGLDHHGVLERRLRHLHAARLADGRVRDIAVARDLVRRVDDDDALVHVVGQHARDLAQHGRLADARPAEEQRAAPGLDQVLDYLDRAEDGAADAAGETDDAPAAVADARDAVQRALDAGA